MVEVIAIFCSGTFFGAAIYISLAQHPASLEAGGSVPGTFFPPMYRRAAPMQIALALVGTITGFIEWYVSEQLIWLLGSIALVSVIPITLILIKPINDILLDPENDPGSNETLALLRSWGPRHWTRSVVGGVSFVLYLAGLARTTSAA